MTHRPTGPAPQFEPDNASQLPDTARTLNGTPFDPRDDIWHIQDPVQNLRLDFRRLDVTPQIRHEAKQTSLWYAENMASATVYTIYKELKYFLKHEAHFTDAPVTRITGTAILRYRTELPPRQAHRLSKLTGFLRKWHALGLSGVTDDAIDVLDRIRIPGRSRLEAVRTLDPHTGPFSRLESSLLHKALEAAHAAGTLPLQDYLLASLFHMLGLRPVQIAPLKVCDVLPTERQDGAAPEIFLNVPRAKQTGGLTREHFHPYFLEPPVGPKIAQYAQQLKDDFAGHLDDPSQAPLFPIKNLSRNSRPEPFAFHATRDTIRQRCTKIHNRLNVRSERVTGPLRANARRHRYTIGTRLAESDTSVHAIADALDHSTTETVGTYVEATASMHDRLDEGLARKLAPIFDAFKGTLSSEDAHPETQNKIAAPDILDNSRPIAACAHHGPCNLFAPIACYTCPYFRPWTDAPHKRVLQFLLEERERNVQKDHPAIAHSLDTTILAVTRVIQKIEELDPTNETDT